MPAWPWCWRASEDSPHLGFSSTAYAPGRVETPERGGGARRAWSSPPGSLIDRLGIGLAMVNRDGLCCPGPASVRAMKLLGYQYAGFEIGHVASCGLDLPRHRDSYGL